MSDISFWQIVNDNSSAFSDVHGTLLGAVRFGVITYAFQKSNNSHKCKKIEKSLIQKQKENRKSFTYEMIKHLLKEKRKWINSAFSLFNEMQSPANFYPHKDIQKMTHRR